MKADLRISIKDYRQKKKLKTLLVRTPFAARRQCVRIKGAPWPGDRRPAALTPLPAGGGRAASTLDPQPSTAPAYFI
jgi:hypothetical protein